MTDLTRRAFLAGAASLPVVAAIGPTVAPEASIVAFNPKAYAAMLTKQMAIPSALTPPTLLLPNLWASACTHFGEDEVRRMGYAPQQPIPLGDNPHDWPKVIA